MVTICYRNDKRYLLVTLRTDQIRRDYRSVLFAMKATKPDTCQIDKRRDHIHRQSTLHNSNSPILSINSYPLVPSQNNLSRTPCTRIKKKKKDLLTHLSSNSHSSIQTTDPNNHTNKLKPPSTRNTCPHFTHPPHKILHPPPPPSRALRLSIKKISSRRNKYLSD